jgi:hypothetical protein
MWSLMSLKFLRRSLMEIPMTAVAAMLCRRRVAGFGVGGRFKVGDALAQHGNEITHDMNDGMFHAEEIGVKIPLRNVPADLAFQAGVELVFGDGFEDGALRIGIGVFRVLSPCSSSAWRWKLYRLFPTAI